jgi:sodium transport system permease protein
MKFLFAVLRKELLDSLRDKRTITTILMTSVLMGPMSLIILSEFIGSLQKDAEKRIVYVDGKAAAPQLENFLLRQGATIKEPPEDYETKIQQGDFQAAVIRVPEDFSTKLDAGEKPMIEVLFESSRTEAQTSIGLATEMVRGFARELGAQRLIARGVSPTLANPVDLERTDLASHQAKGAQILFIIPMIALIACVVGSLSVAIDVTAGERERGSLEPLLTTPGQRLSIVVGKWLTVCIFGWAVIVLTLLGFWGATKIVRSEALASLMQFGAPEIVNYLLLLVPFACFVASLQMLVATYGRTFKEAQTYASYIVVVINFVPLLSLLIKQKDQLWQLFVPAMGQQFVMERVIRGETLNPMDFVFPGITALLLAAVFLMAQKGLLEQEKIVFGRA